VLYPTELRGLFPISPLARSAPDFILYLTSFGLGNRCSIQLSYGTGAHSNSRANRASPPRTQRGRKAA
jgi:hypothetical protein